MKNSKRYEKWWLRLLGWTIPFGDPCEEPHEHVLMDGVQIDVRIAPLVQLLWNKGIETQNSCEGDPVLHELWRKHGMNLSLGGEGHCAYLTFGSRREVDWVASVMEMYRRRGALGEVTIREAAPSLDRDSYYFLNFPPQALDDPSFMKYMREMLAGPPPS